MKSIRIGVDIRNLLTGKLSGVGQYTIQTLKHLLEIDKTNTYVLFYNSYRDIDERFKKLVEDYPFLNNSNVEVKKSKWINLPLLIHAFYKPFNWPKADIVCGGLDVMFMPSPQLLPLSSRCAKITTFHDLIFLIYPEYFTRSSRLWQWQMNYPYEARTSDIVIAVSEATKADVLRFTRANDEQIRVIPEGVSEEYFKVLPPDVIQSVKNKFNLPDKYIFFVGNIEPRKNLSTVVRALHELKPHSSDTIKLVLAGGKSWLTDDLYQVIDELNMKDDVVFTGWVTEVEKIAMLSNAEMLVFPSHYEGFGLMILEAFATKCPVISSDMSSLPEVAGDAALLVNPKNHLALAKQIQRLLSDDELKQTLVNRGYERARQFSWEKSALRTLDAIYEAIKKHGE